MVAAGVCDDDAVCPRGAANRHTAGGKIEDLLAEHGREVDRRGDMGGIGLAGGLINGDCGRGGVDGRQNATESADWGKPDNVCRAVIE